MIFSPLCLWEQKKPTLNDLSLYRYYIHVFTVKFEYVFRTRANKIFHK